MAKFLNYFSTPYIYRPKGTSSTVINRKLFGGLSTDADEVLAIPFALLMFPLAGPIWISCLWYKNKRHRASSGRHKKIDV